MVHYRPNSKTPFDWRFTGGPVEARNCMYASCVPYLFTCFTVGGGGWWTQDNSNIFQAMSL